MKVDFGEEKQRQWSALLDLPLHQTIDLPPGTGGWIARFTPSASVRRLSNELPLLIAELMANATTEYDVRFTWPATELGQTMAVLGVDRVSLVLPGTKDRCVLFTQSHAGVVPTDAASAVTWVSECFNDPRFANSWNRLAASDAEEKHAFIWIESGAPDDLRLRVSFHPETPPPTRPVVPGWLTHLWVGIPVSFTPQHWTWPFQPGAGWEAIAGE